MGFGRRGALGTAVVSGLAIALAIAGVVAALDLQDGDYEDGDSSGTSSADHVFTSPDKQFASAVDVNGTLYGETIAFEGQDNVTTYHLNSTLDKWQKDRVFENFSSEEPDQQLPYYGNYSYRGEAVAMNHDPNGALIQPSNVLAFRAQDAFGVGGGEVEIWRRPDPDGTVDPTEEWIKAYWHTFDYTVGSVALSDEAIAVGFPDAEGGSGAVFIGKLDDDQEVTEDLWIKENSGDSDALGIDVAAEGNMVLIGDPTGSWDEREHQNLSDTQTDSQGLGYALAFDVATETLVSVIDPSDGWQFGQSVDLSGTKETTGLIGAPAWEHPNGYRVGRAWRCSGLDTVSVSCTDVIADQAGGNDVNEPGAFGASVAIWDGSMAIGAPEDRNGKPAKQSGAIFVYEDGTQTHERIQPDSWDNEDTDDFGAGVAWNGDALWGGNPAENGADGVGFFWN